jgi:hypothetical protein
MIFLVGVQVVGSHSCFMAISTFPDTSSIEFPGLTGRITIRGRSQQLAVVPHLEPRDFLCRITCSSGLPALERGARHSSHIQGYKIVTKDTFGGVPEWPDHWNDRLRVMCGLLITILAVSLGAPFWFDVLGRINPKPSGTDRPASSVSIQPIPAVPAPVGNSSATSPATVDAAVLPTPPA